MSVSYLANELKCYNPKARETGVIRTYIVAIRSIEVVWFNKIHMRIRNHTCIMEMVLPICMRKQSVSNKDVASLCDNAREILALGYVFVQHIFKGRVETFWVVIKILANTYTIKVY